MSCNHIIAFRMNDEQLARLRRLQKHYDLPQTDLLRFLVKEKADALGFANDDANKDGNARP